MCARERARGWAFVSLARQSHSFLFAQRRATSACSGTVLQVVSLLTVVRVRRGVVNTVPPPATLPQEEGPHERCSGMTNNGRCGWIVPTASVREIEAAVLHLPPGVPFGSLATRCAGINSTPANHVPSVLWAGTRPWVSACDATGARKVFCFRCLWGQSIHTCQAQLFGCRGLVLGDESGVCFSCATPNTVRLDSVLYQDLHSLCVDELDGKSVGGKCPTVVFPQSTSPGHHCLACETDRANWAMSICGPNDTPLPGVVWSQVPFGLAYPDALDLAVGQSNNNGRLRVATGVEKSVCAAVECATSASAAPGACTPQPRVQCGSTSRKRTRNKESDSGDGEGTHPPKRKVANSLCGVPVRNAGQQQPRRSARLSATCKTPCGTHAQ